MPLSFLHQCFPDDEVSSWASGIFLLHITAYLNLVIYWLLFFILPKVSFQTQIAHSLQSISSNFTTALDVWSVTIVQIKFSLFLVSIILYAFELPPYLTVYFLIILTPFSLFYFLMYKYYPMLLVVGYFIFSLVSLKTPLAQLLVHVPITEVTWR